MSAPLPPTPGLMPLTSSKVADVSSIFQRRLEARIRGGANTVVERNDEGGQEPSTSRRAESSPALNGSGVGGAPRSYTLGELIETVRARKSQARRMIEADDLDGPEAVAPPMSILGRAMQFAEQP